MGVQGYSLSSRAAAAEKSWRGVVPAREKRMITNIPGIERPGTDILSVLGLGGVALPVVTTDSALTCPPFLAGVSFLSRSLAALPLHVFRNTANGPERVSGGIQTLVHEAPNANWTSFKLRSYFWQQIFTGGRGLIWIERSGSNITGLYPINPANATIKRDSLGRMTYTVDGKDFDGKDVIDVPFMLKSDGLAHYSPVNLGARAIQLALAMNEYGSKFFAGGGVPPLAVEGPLPAGNEAMKRAMAEIKRTIETAASGGDPYFALPPGYKLTQVGFDPDKGQMTEARRFQIEEIARVFQLPPVFLQDLSHGTFSNTEQQDLHLVKHLLSQWVQALEEEMNLKLFGQRNGGRYVEHNMDGLLRGDFLSRMTAYSTSVQNAVRTPNEVRALENLPPVANGNDLLIQGATVPLGSQNVAQDAQGGNNGI